MNQLAPTKFVFFGEDVFSLVVLESLINSNLNLEPLFIVMLEPVSVSGQRLVKYCAVEGIPLLQTKSLNVKEFLDNFNGLQVDLIISAHFQRIFPRELFSKAILGALNLHPSLLPKYRGMSPQHWPIALGETETGVTVHLIDEGVDTGNILCQERINLTPHTYIHELQKKLLVAYQTIMVDAVGKLLRGDRGRIQISMDEPYFGKIKEQDTEIRLVEGVDKAYRLIRAFSYPYCGARFDQLKIMKAVPVSSECLLKINKHPDSLGILQQRESVYIVFTDGALELIKWEKI